MGTPEDIGAAVREMLRLQDRELSLRCSARILELLPERADEVRDLFRMANRLREKRLALLDRCGIAR
jgi:DNA-directed RNA polymerase subunit F